MATISLKDRVEDLIGTSITDTSGLDVMIEGTVAEISGILPERTKLQHAVLSTSTSVEGKEVYSVSRGGYYATEIPKGLSIQANDTNSIHKATTEAPVFYFENSQVVILPSGGESQVLAYEQPLVTNASSTIPNFPSTGEYTVVLGTACKELIRMISTARDALPTVVPQPVINYTDASIGDAIASAQDGYTGEDTVTPGDASYVGPGTNAGGLTTLTAGAKATGSDYLKFDTWFDIVSEYIEEDEDIELAKSSLEKIQTYIATFRSEIENSANAMQAEIASARETTSANQAVANSKTSASVAKMTQSTNAAIAKMGKSSDVNVQNASQALQAAIAEYSQVIAKYQQDMARSTVEIQTIQRQHDSIYGQYQQQLQILSGGALQGGAKA